MKILTVGDFDPCQVALHHRGVMRARGHDCRVAVLRVFVPEQKDVDWIWGHKGDRAELVEFALNADVIQFHPGIGQPWSYQSTIPELSDADRAVWPEVNGWPALAWSTIRGPQKVFYFHGSRNAWHNRKDYSAEYGCRGALWASTIDYASELPARYVPPTIPVPLECASMRGEHMPLVIAHAPTDPDNCSTEAFMGICRRAGVPVSMCVREDHDTVMLRKASCNAGFDHLRGCFSVNTLENAALGLVPLVGIRPAWRNALYGWPKLPFLPIHNLESLEMTIRSLSDSVVATREAQIRAMEWFAAFSAQAADNLEAAYAALDR